MYYIVALYAAIIVLVIIEYVLQMTGPSYEPDLISYSYRESLAEYIRDNPNYSSGGTPFPTWCVANAAVPAVLVGCSLIISFRWGRGQ